MRVCVRLLVFFCSVSRDPIPLVSVERLVSLFVNVETPITWHEINRSRCAFISNGYCFIIFCPSSLALLFHVISWKSRSFGSSWLGFLISGEPKWSPFKRVFRLHYRLIIVWIGYRCRSTVKFYLFLKNFGVGGPSMNENYRDREGIK